MRVVPLPHGVREIEHCWIPLDDGCRLAARLWLPEHAQERPVPALLEYLPYGKREGTRERDEPMHRYFAGHGVAAVRVDLRGTGDSDGVLLDEYLEQEQRDGEQVIAWIAAQAWCDGNVGMIGKSWGGFNALQLAARRPPALRGVVSVCASDDRYADDAHFTGGCLLVENFRWGATLFTLAAHPPDPALVGAGWRERWRERLAAAEPFAARWLRHPLRDAYWRQGSVGEDPARVACPVWAVGGWADGYSNAVPRLVAGLAGPRRGLVGPWAHLYPHEGVPGPAIGFLGEVLRFFEVAFRDGDVPAGPRLRAWLQASVPPRHGARQRPGRWVAEEAWPSPRLRARRFALAAAGLREAPAAAEPPLTLAPDQTLGAAAGVWCAFGHPEDLPDDQRGEDARSLAFTSEPLDAPLEILGAPRLRLRLAVDRPAAFLVARLVDVAPDGASALVSWGVRNLAHSDDHTRHRPCRPGEPRELVLALDDAGHAFPAGHRLRLALSTAWWPIVWPSPAPVTLTVFPGHAELVLPERPPRAEDAALPPFGPPETAGGAAVEARHPAGLERRVERDPATGAVLCVTRSDFAPDGRPALARMADIDLEVGYAVEERTRIHPEDPLAAACEIAHTSVLRRAGFDVEIATRTRVTADAGALRLEAELRALEAGREVHARRFDERIPRRGI